MPFFSSVYLSYVCVGVLGGGGGSRGPFNVGITRTHRQGEPSLDVHRKVARVALHMGSSSDPEFLRRGKHQSGYHCISLFGQFD